jgi:hypothetical protein
MGGSTWVQEMLLRIVRWLINVLLTHLGLEGQVSPYLDRIERMIQYKQIDRYRCTQEKTKKMGTKRCGLTLTKSQQLPTGLYRFQDIVLLEGSAHASRYSLKTRYRNRQMPWPWVRALGICMLIQPIVASSQIYYASDPSFNV